jgi:hypothetical protein
MDDNLTQDNLINLAEYRKKMKDAEEAAAAEANANLSELEELSRRGKKDNPEIENADKNEADDENIESKRWHEIAKLISQFEEIIENEPSEVNTETKKPVELYEDDETEKIESIDLGAGYDWPDPDDLDETKKPLN